MRSRPSALAAAAIVASLCCAAPASAQISFARPTFFPVGGEASRVVTGDWNGDGLVDVATANNSSGNASTVEGDGTGKFLPPTTHAVGGRPSDIAAGDFNGDGSQDLVVATQSSSGAVVLFGSPSGAFAAPVDVAVGGSPFQVESADLNGDGRSDLVCTTTAPGGPNVTVTLASPGGGFGGPTGYNVSGPPADVKLGDLNRDNRLDIVTGENAAQLVSVLLANPDGSFGPAQSTSVPGRPRRLATGDFDKDGAADVAVTTIPPNLSILLAKGDGTFRAKGAVASSDAQDVVIADFDRDLILDIGLIGGGAATLQGDGTGAFARPVEQPPAGGAAAAVADVDGDGMPDIVVANGSNGAVLPNISGGGAPGPLAAPVVAKSANVAPVNGTVLLKQPGKRSFIRLEDAAHIPIGSELDVTKGSVRLESAAGGGETQSGVFRGGLFKLGQKKGKRPITDLKLSAKLRCVKSRGPVRKSAKRPRSRRLFGNAHGRFRTRGRNSTASIRGTKWLVKDTCNSTLTVAQRGTVVVRDLVKRRTVTLKTGQRYLARGKR